MFGHKVDPNRGCPDYGVLDQYVDAKIKELRGTLLLGVFLGVVAGACLASLIS